MWRALEVFANRALVSERDALRQSLRDRTRTVELQADVITQLRKALGDDPTVRPCECGVRWFRWHDGLVAGPDGLVGGSDDLTPLEVADELARQRAVEGKG